MKKDLFIVPAILVGLPAVGIWLTGKPFALYLEFPPQTTYVTHAPFCWPVFAGLALFVTMVCAPVVHHILTFRGKNSPARGASYPMPWWSICGLVLIGISWSLAWSRFPWFAFLQAYTFFPLWLGYILVANGLAFKRSGHCPLLERPRSYLFLFPISSVFWWYFEYLNRFVQNWHYLGIEGFSASEYVLHASLCFSTVLPAVIATEAYLATFPRLTKPLHHYRVVTTRRRMPVAWSVLGLAVLALAGTGLWPDLLFPMLWLAPLAIITSIQTIRGEKIIFTTLARGDWRPVWLAALAALLCGFFWEMWNFRSLAHWEYSVPFVHRFTLFEMPILGYGGYLPFGLVCRVIADLFAGPKDQVFQGKTKLARTTFRVR